MWLALVGSKVASTGVSDDALLPLPSSPLPFEPQHFGLAPATSAQLW
jgi:hypothetical protein